MYLARIRHVGPDGPTARIVATTDPASGWIDVRIAERLRLERSGTGAAAARRIAAAIVPASLSAAADAGRVFLDAAARAAADISGDARTPEDTPFTLPLEPVAYRDFMAFERHFSFGYKWRGVAVPDVMYEMPVSYIGSTQAFIGPEDEVPWPHYSEHLDYELELGIVIGRSGRDVYPDRAMDYVLGLTVLNDFSARDIQRREMEGGLGPSKGKHFATALGPWIATPDELPAAGLTMTAKVNGETTCRANSSEMIWSIAEIVAWAAAGEQLAAGTLLGSGTCNGGSGIELGRKLAPGDVVELEIDKLGVLRNRLGTPGTGWMPAHRAH